MDTATDARRPMDEFTLPSRTIRLGPGTDEAIHQMIRDGTLVFNHQFDFRSRRPYLPSPPSAAGDGVILPQTTRHNYHDNGHTPVA